MISLPGTIDVISDHERIGRNGTKCAVFLLFANDKGLRPLPRGGATNAMFHIPPLPLLSLLLCPVLVLPVRV